MLPFLKQKQDAGGIAGTIIKNRQPDEKPEQDQDDPSAAIKACASGLIDAVHRRDAESVADHLADAFEILESMPHEEAAPHSYEDQAED